MWYPVISRVSRPGPVGRGVVSDRPVGVFGAPDIDRAISMTETSAWVAGTHSVRAGEFEQAHETWEDASLQLRLARDDVTLQTAVTNAARARRVAREAVVDGLHHFARSIAGCSLTHDRVAERIRLLSLRWAKRATAIEAPEKWDRGVWETQYQFIAAVGGSDTEGQLQEILGRFPEDFVCVRKTREASASAKADKEPQYVTLDQVAALVSRKKRTLEHYKRAEYKGNGDPLPDPDVKGGGGKPALWLYPGQIKAWLEATFKQKLPDRVADPFRAGADRD